MRAIIVAGLLLAASVAGAQQEPAENSPYLFVIDARVDAEVARLWSTALGKTAEAHALHESGNTWATFKKMTGGPEAEFRFVFPMQRLGDLDAWKSNRKIVTEALGNDLGRQVLRQLETGSASTDRILALSPELSRPEPDRVARYLWTIRVKVDGGKKVEYAALMRRVKQAHDRHERGMHWLVYGNAVGGDPDEVLWVMPFEKFAEIDGWALDDEVLRKVYGDDEANRLIDALNAISTTTERVWRLMPGLSRLPEH